MFQVAYNCKKCPMQEQVDINNVVHGSQDQKQAQPDVAAGSTIQAPKVCNNQPGPKNASFKAQTVKKSLVLTDPDNDFFVSELDDRSTHFVKPRTGLLVALLLVQFLSQTPGIGSTQSVSQFVISQREVAKA